MNTYYRTIKAISGVAAINDVIECDNDTGVITNLNLNKDITFVNCNNLAFFMPINDFNIDDPKFVIGDIVNYKYADSKNIYEVTNLSRTIKCLNKGVKIVYRYNIKNVNNGEEIREINEKDLIELIYYYFINSNCQVHRAVVLGTEADIYRKLTKNWYKTKEEADAVLDKLFKKNFNCTRGEFHYKFNNMNGLEILNNICI